MAAPTEKVRAGVLRRDDDKCVRCGERVGLEMHHRARVGMGGSRVRPAFPELLTVCATCNAGFESDLQDEALAYGWKVKTWACPGLVPVYLGSARRWVLLSFSGEYLPISTAAAHILMRGMYGDDWDGWASSLGYPLGLEGEVTWA